MEPVIKNLFDIKKQAAGGITTTSPYSQITTLIQARERPEVVSIPEVIARETATYGEDVQYQVVEPEPTAQFKIQPWHLLVALGIVFLIARK